MAGRHAELAQSAHSDSFMQIAGQPTGLTLSNGDAINFQTAVTAINALRDALGGTTSSSVESSLTRSSAPVLFAADASSVAYTRIPRQVGSLFFMCYTVP